MQVLDYVLCLDFFLIIADCILSSHETVSVIKICTPFYFCILAWQPDIFTFHLYKSMDFTVLITQTEGNDCVSLKSFSKFTYFFHITCFCWNING